MKRITLILIALVSFSMTTTAQTVVGDATLPNTMTLEGSSLALNGAGMREKLWIDLYAGGLYTQSKMKNAKAVVNADETMVMKLHIVSKLITTEKMVDAVNDGFDAAMNGDTSSLASEIEKFKGFFNYEIKNGNVIDIAYVKGKGSVAYSDGKELGSIPGLAFKKALFAIWLGNDPADKGLKKDMLKG